MLTVIETHPIQYHAPVYRAVEQRHGIPVTAVYASDFSVAGYRDAEFRQTFAWDTDLLSGYSAVFLSRVATGGAPDAERASTRGLRQTLRQLHPSAVMVVGYSPAFHRAAWREALRCGAPLLVRAETNDAARTRSGARALVRDAALRCAYRTCARCLYVGVRSHEHYRRLGVSEARLVSSPYCVDATPFSPGEQARATWRVSTRHALGVDPGDRVVLFSGKLSPRKGIDLLVEAIRQLDAAERDRTLLVCLGDGAMREAVEQAASRAPRVRLVVLGFRNQRELSPYYHAADVLALPSREGETWGLVVNEALLHGLPVVVSTRVGCHGDLVTEGVTGVVCEAGSASALRDGLRRGLALAGDPAVREACRLRVEAYSVDRAASGIVEAYRAVVRERPV